MLDLNNLTNNELNLVYEICDATLSAISVGKMRGYTPLNIITEMENALVQLRDKAKLLEQDIISGE